MTESGLGAELGRLLCGHPKGLSGPTPHYDWLLGSANTDPEFHMVGSCMPLSARRRRGANKLARTIHADQKANGSETDGSFAQL